MKKTLHVANVAVMIHTFRFQLLLALQRKGYEIHIAGASTNPDLIADFEKAGFIFHEIPIERGLNITNAIKCTLMMRKLIKKHKFDIVHTNTPTGGMIGRMGAYLGGQKKIYHTTAGFYFHENMSPKKYKFYSGIEKYLAKKTHILFSPNKEDIATCHKLNIKPKDEIVYCGPSGVKLDRYNISEKENSRTQLCKELKLTEDTFIIGSVGRLVWEKGFKEFIDTMALINKTNKKTVAVCVGRGPQDQEILDYAKLKEVSNIIFVGFTREVPRYLLGFDLFLFPSHREGFPIATLEAMAAETPVVAFDIRGCRESIVEGETGYIVPFKDTMTMHKRVVELIDDSDLLFKMGIQGRQRVIDNFTKVHHVEKQLPYY